MKQLIAILLIICLMNIFVMSPCSFADSGIKSLSALERMEMINNLERNSRNNSGWFCMILGAADYYLGGLLSNYPGHSGPDFNIGPIFGPVAQICGTLAFCSGARSVWFVKSPIEKEYENILKVEPNNKETSARQYLLFLKQNGNTNIIWGDSKLVSQEVDQYFEESSKEPFRVE